MDATLLAYALVLMIATGVAYTAGAPTGITAAVGIGAVIMLAVGAWYGSRS